VTGLQRGNRLETAAIFVSEREAIQEIFEREESDFFEVGRAAGTDTFQKLEGRRQNGVRSLFQVRL
jgi:hypothetical protein